MKPLIIFKGTEGGRITQSFQQDRELSQKCFFTQNKTAWMTTELWEEYLTLLFPNNQKHRLVIFDTAACHGYNHQTSCFDPGLQQRLNQKMIHVSIVPESCTPLVQPNDTHINRPFKRGLCSLWTEFMVNNVNRTEKVSKPEMRKHVVAWVVKALSQITSSTISQAFRDCGITLALDGSEEHLCRVDVSPFEKLHRSS